MRIKLWLAGASLALGTLTEAALWNHRAGPGWLLVTGLTFLLTRELGRRLERRMASWVWLLWGSALAFSLGLVLYDGSVLHQIAPWMAGASLSLAVFWSLAGPAPMEAFGYPGWLVSWANFPQMMQDSVVSVRDLGGPRAGWTKVLQGLVLAAPFVLLFGLLFLAADPYYSLQLSQLGLHLGPLGRSLLFAFMLLGWLHHNLLRAGAGERPATPWQADPTVMGVALACLNLLFASFLLSQASYLFSGTAHPGFTLAEYARRGFFELVTATLLVLGLVLASYATLHRRQHAGGALGLLALLILQTFGLAGSAVHRMTLYIQSYGLTLTRTYVEMALLGICLTLLLVLAALLRRPDQSWLTARMLLLGLVMMAAAALVDVERLIAEVNVARYRAGASIDMPYLGQLSTDALPALKGLDGSAEREIRARLEPLDWRTFNLSRMRASLE